MIAGSRGAALCAAVIALLARPALAEDVPYVATPDETVAVMLTMAAVGPDDVVIDLGSGDGRIVISAVEDFGARRALGIEINPRLVAAARAAADRVGVANRVEFREQNLFDTDFSAATVLTMYLLPDLNLRLRSKVLAMRPGTRVVSHEFDMGDWMPDERRTVLGNEHPRGPSVVHFWVVPANVAGTWSWSDRGREVELAVRQRYQRIDAELSDDRVVADARLTGDRVRIVARSRSAAETVDVETVYEGRVIGDGIDGTATDPGMTPLPWRAARRGG